MADKTSLKRRILEGRKGDHGKMEAVPQDLKELPINNYKLKCIEIGIDWLTNKTISS